MSEGHTLKQVQTQQTDSGPAQSNPNQSNPNQSNPAGSNRGQEHPIQPEGYAIPRRQMCEKQLRGRDIFDSHVLAAMDSVPREMFVPPQWQEEAYADRALPLSQGQTISQPYMVALMTQLLSLEADHRVLEVGTGSGYQAAVLAKIVREVYTVERYQGLAQAARSVLRKLRLTNVTFLVGDGTLGYPPAAPYDRIIVTAGGPRIPPSLFEQLVEGGRLVMPVGGGEHQVLQIIDKQDGQMHQQQMSGCRFVPLVGRQGWQEKTTLQEAASQ